jgi:hypothetical protein
LRDPELRARLSHNARRLVEERFSAANVAHVFEEICLHALEAKTARGTFRQTGGFAGHSGGLSRGPVADRVP